MFEVLERKKSDYLVLIPGWAFDRKIFSTLDLPYNYILPSDISNSKFLVDFEKGLKGLLKKKNIKKVSIFGWSQGAFLACNFVHRNQDVIEEVFLVSVKRKYAKKDLENVKNCLKKNKTAYLYQFYKDCFSSKERASLSWFRKGFLKSYLQEMDLDDLIYSLDWLSRAKIDADLLREIKKIKIIHGRSDKIIPFEEALSLKKDLPQAHLVVFEDTGHLPFLRGDFKEGFYSG